MKGLGVCYATKYFLSLTDECKRVGVTPELEGKTVIVQGFGNVGYHAAYFFEARAFDIPCCNSSDFLPNQKFGAKVIGVVEYNGAVYNPKGLDVTNFCWRIPELILSATQIEALKAHMSTTGSLLGFSGATKEVKISLLAERRPHFGCSTPRKRPWS